MLNSCLQLSRETSAILMCMRFPVIILTTDFLILENMEIK